MVPVKTWTIPYNLACYASRLHRFDEAQKWLKQAMEVDAETVQAAAQEDEDLKPLWDNLGGVLAAGCEFKKRVNF